MSPDLRRETRTSLYLSLGFGDGSGDSGARRARNARGRQTEEEFSPFVLLSALTDKRTAHGRNDLREEHGFAVQKGFHRRYGDRLRNFIFARGTGKTNRAAMFIADVRTFRKDSTGYLANLCSQMILKQISYF